MWKPASEGTFLLDGRVSFTYEDNGLIVDCGGIAIQPGSWSLFRPDMQPGAPTVAQLERWQWWALWLGINGVSSLACVPGGDDIAAAANWSSEMCQASVNVVHSAPIQADLNWGPLWVPLDVA